MNLTVSSPAPLEATRGAPCSTPFEARLSSPAGPAGRLERAEASEASPAGPASTSEAGLERSRLQVVDGPSLGARVVQRVQRAQGELDRILALAESGRSFTPAELLALQAITYRAGHELEVAGKLVEKATSAVKQTLQTQL